MRRRILLGSSSPYVFSAATTSVSVGASSGSIKINITSQYSGITTGFTIESYDNAVIKSVTNNSNTAITVTYNKNLTSSQLIGSINLKQTMGN